mgnify:CR=1 FL=1
MNTNVTSNNINRLVDVYTIGGILVRRQIPYIQSTNDLEPGMYIIGGEIVVVK